MQTDPRSFLPLSTPVLHILLSLVDEERHGYGIMTEVKKRTHDEVRLGPGTLYGAIKRLIGEGLIETSGDRLDPELDDERRTYYKLSGLGAKVVQAEIERLQSIIQQANRKKLAVSPLKPFSLTPNRFGGVA
jgi:DNA-binding PadR family transcriptional regulator